MSKQKHRFTTYSTQVVKESCKLYAVDNVVSSPENVVDIAVNVLNLHQKTQEHLVMLALNTKNIVIGMHTVHIGSTNMSIVHPKDIFQRAILNNAAAIMILHNHPSGNPTPSNEDIDVTKTLVDAGNLLGIPVLDHIIVGEHDTDIDINDYISLRERHYVSFS